MTRTRTAANVIGSRLTGPAGAPVAEGTLTGITVAGMNLDGSAPHGPIGR